MSDADLPEPLQRRALAVLGLALLLPVLLALIVFPTPMYDTRELIAWGREFPLVTPFHPPMMVWIGGTIDKFFGTSAAVMILTGQLLIALGLIYFHLTLRLVTTRGNAVLLTFLYGTTSYIVFAPLSFALNADILQLTSWPAIIFHFLRAVGSNRLRHWIAFGFWSAVAVLTKYNAAVLFLGMTAAILMVPAYRATLRRPGVYLATAIGVGLVMPHAIAVLKHAAAFEYGLDHFDLQNPMQQRLSGIGELVMGYLMFAAPAYLVALSGLWRGFLHVGRPNQDSSSEHRFLLITALSAHISLVALVMLTGLNFLARFSPPYIMLTFLAIAPLIEWSDRCRRWVDREVIPFVGGLYLIAGVVIAVTFTMFASHSAMQEPTREAARMILKDWDNNYACGPAYSIGGRQVAYGLGIDAERNLTAFSYKEMTAAPWYDESKLRARGAIVVDIDPNPEERIIKYLPGRAYSDERTVSVPLQRTLTGKHFVYRYRFVAPQDCNATSPSR